MQSAIVYVALPSDGSHDARQTGGSFLAAIAKLEGNKAAKHVWEVDFRASPDALAVIVRACEQLQLPYGILPLADGQQWIRRDPNSKE
jgi:hypothetical protein